MSHSSDTSNLQLLVKSRDTFSKYLLGILRQLLWLRFAGFFSVWVFYHPPILKFQAKELSSQEQKPYEKWSITNISEVSQYISLCLEGYMGILLSNPLNPKGLSYGIDSRSIYHNDDVSKSYWEYFMGQALFKPLCVY